MTAQCLLDKLRLHRNARRRQARPDSRDLFRRSRADGGCNRRCNRRVSDPHLAYRQKVDALACERRHLGTPNIHRPPQLSRGHRSTERKISRPGKHLPAPHIRQALAITGDADVDDVELGIQCTPEHIDRRPASIKCTEHLSRHALRIRTHTVDGNPVIAGEDENSFANRQWWQATSNAKGLKISD